MNAPHALLARLQALGVLRPLDVEIGHGLLELEPPADPALALLAATVSLAVAQGHSCLPLAQVPAVLGEACPDGVTLPELPSREAMLAALRASPWAGPADDAACAPLLHDTERVWLGRYFHHEARVAAVLHGLLRREDPVPTAAALRAALAPFFDLDAREPDRQALAALTGLVSPLTVITGGPGTGKTTTVLWLLAAWAGLRLADGHAVAAHPPGRADRQGRGAARANRCASAWPTWPSTRPCARRCRRGLDPASAARRAPRQHAVSAIMPGIRWIPTWWWSTRSRWSTCR